MCSLCLRTGVHYVSGLYNACFAGWAIVQNLGMPSLLGRIDFLCKAIGCDIR